MPRKKTVKSTVELNEEPNRRAKVSAVEREMNTALELMDSHRDSEKTVKGPSVGALCEIERGKRKESGLAQYKLVSTEKHTDNMRHKIAYVADQLIEEMAHEVSKKTKKDKEYLKGLTWSFGVLHDKLTAVNTEATLVSLPTKLLAAVKDVITAQVEVAKAHAVNLVASAELAKVNALSSQPHGESRIVDVTAKPSIQQGAAPTKEPIDVTPMVQAPTGDYIGVSSPGQDTSEDYVGTSHNSTPPISATSDEKLRT